jgi:hypothetical protein
MFTKKRKKAITVSDARMRIHVRSIKTAADAVPEPKNNKGKKARSRDIELTPKS